MYTGSHPVDFAGDAIPDEHNTRGNGGETVPPTLDSGALTEQHNIMRSALPCFDCILAKETPPDGMH